MNEDQSSSDSANRTWLEKIGQALSGEPKDRAELIETVRGK